MKRLRRQNNMKITGLSGAAKRSRSMSVYQSDRFIRSITNSMPGLVAYFDRGVRCQFANQSYLDWYQRSLGEVIGASLMELMGESLYAVNAPFVRAVLEGKKQSFERFMTRPDGTVGHVLADYIPYMGDHGNVDGFFIFVTDLKAQKLAQTDLKLAANVFQNMAEGIFITDADGIILSVNPAFTRITGYQAEVAIGQTPRMLRSDRHDQSFYTTLWEEIALHGKWTGEIWNRRKDGAVFLAGQTINRIADKEEATTRYVSVFHDITDSWQTNEDNRHLAFHDALTNLPNRALLKERLERRISSAERDPRLIAVIFIDLDGFKTVNDTLGHAAGDELLIVISHRLLALVRQSDTVARLGGDEFVIKLDNPSNQAEVMQVADRVIADINQTIEIEGAQVQVGASIGIAMFPDHGTTASELMKSADSAMYEAKHSGKNTYRFFSKEMPIAR